MDAWKEFEKGLRKYLPKSDAEVIHVLRRKYLRTIKEFRQSKQCRTILRQCLQRITTQPNRIYMILNELKSTLKLRTTDISLNISPKNGTSSVDRVTEKSTSPTSKSNSVTKASDVPDSNSPAVIDLDGDDVVILDLHDSSTTASASVPTTTDVCPSVQSAITPDAVSDNSTVENSRKLLIVRLENLLSRLSTAIRRLEEQELDFDALDSPNSSYLQLDTLKRRYLQVWHRLCDARKVARTSGRILRRRFSYNGSKHANINRRIEQLVNDRHRFPDFTDIRHIVSQVNKEDGLGLSLIGTNTLAREIFVDVGHLLKRRRQDDLRHDFGCHLTDDLREEDDPTYFDPVLRGQLAQNKQIAESNLNAVFDKFVHYQDEGVQECDSSESDEVDIALHPSGDKSTNARVIQTENDVSCELSSSEDDVQAGLSDEVLTLSSDSESECRPSDALCLSQSQRSPSFGIVPSRSSLVTELPPSPGSPNSSVINLTADDTASDTSAHNSDPTPLNKTTIRHPTISVPPSHSLSHNFVAFSSRLIPSLQPCSAGPLIQETRHSSRTFTVTHQFGLDGNQTFMSSTQTATSNMVCQQVVSAPYFPPLNIPPHVPFVPLTPHRPKPSRGRLVPAPQLDRPRRSVLDSVIQRRPSMFSPGVNQPPPDSETIVLD